MKEFYLNNPQLKRANVNIQFTEDQIAELDKCSKDPVYFIENYIKIITLDKGIQSIQLYGFQKKIIKTIQDNRFVICKIARQSGKSTTTMAWALHYIMFNPNVNVCVLADKGVTSKNLLGIVKTAYQNLPKWMQLGIVEWNKTSIIFENGSKIIASPTSANSARGTSVNVLILDEFAHVQNNVAEEFYSSAYPTISSGQTSKIIVISTPKGMNLFYKLWTDAVNKRNQYIPIEARWTEVPGRNQAFKDTTIANFASGNKEAQWRAEFEVEFLGSENTLINPTKIGAIPSIDPIARRPDGLEVFKFPEKDKTYIICVDTSRGYGLDFHVAQVIDVTFMPYEIVAKYRNSELSPQLLPNVINRIGLEYNQASVLVEINDLGVSVAESLKMDLEYPNMILVANMGKKGQKANGGYGEKVQSGLNMSHAVKQYGCAVLKDLIENDKLIINDFDTICELSTFVSSGKTYAASEGHHDDCVMPLVMLGWLINQTYFKELTNTNTKKRLFEEKMKQIEESVSLFGYIEDGITDYEEENENSWLNDINPNLNINKENVDELLKEISKDEKKTMKKQANDW